MNDTDFLHLLMRFQDGVLTAGELDTLEAAMRDDPAKRELFADTQLRSMALHDRFRRDAFQSGCGSSRNPQSNHLSWITRPVAAMAAGLLIGLFSASIVWAISSPKATTERLFSLLNGGFEENHLAPGFPTQAGLWSGDEAVIVDEKLHFISPGSDLGDPAGRAVACDVFQLVDLRPLRHTLSLEGDSVLELSAKFFDSRPPNTKPSVTFFCQLYLFHGDPPALHESWPRSLTDTLASGCAQVTTLGTDAKGPRTLTAKCLVPADADFAVIQIAARPNLRPAKLDNLYADDVKLTLKKQPSLQVRVVQK